MSVRPKTFESLTEIELMTSQTLDRRSLFTFHTREDFDSVDPSSVQGACHIWTQLNDLAPHDFS